MKRYQTRTLRAAAGLLLLLLLVATGSAVRAEDARPAVRVAAIGMTVRDLDRSVAFYHDVLGFEEVGATEEAGAEFERLTGVFGARFKTARMKLGEEELQLTEFLAPRGRSLPEDARANDLAFQHIAIIVRDMDEAYARLRAFDVEHASTGPQELPAWNKAAGGIKAFYFRDPDGHFLEVLQFPPDKGNSRWHEPTDKLFLGIDHTAIVVADTEASLKFYRDLAGLSVAGESENYGTEQEHLNNVFGARLRITTLRGKSGPGVELLEYLAPRDGRQFPVDSQANDLWHWQTLIETDATTLTAQLRAAHTPVVSAGGIPADAATFASSACSKSAAFAPVIVRDPTGHAVMFTHN